VATAAALAFLGCVPRAQRTGAPATAASCRALDSLLARGGLRGAPTMRGRVTIDVNEYRVRGRFTLTVSEAGDAVFEFTSSSVGGREDAVVSFYADTLRMLDRERGAYYEGPGVDSLVSEAAGFHVNAAEVVRRVIGVPPPCRRLSDLRVEDSGESAVVGARLDGRDATVRLAGGRTRSCEWPAPFTGTARAERLAVSYRWQGEAAAEVTVSVPGLRWRIRLQSDF
jgi:hypothetical protein